MADTVIRIDGNAYKLVATVNEGSSLYFAAESTIAVEKFDMRIGGVEFDFQVNSRGVRNGGPDSIAAMQDSLNREFMESRVKSNLYGLPISMGNLTTMAAGRRIELSYGELRPQLFRSSIRTNQVAWRIWFKRTHYTGQASVLGLRGGTRGAPAAKAGAGARVSATIAANSTGSMRGGGSHTIGSLTNDAGIPRVYVPAGGPFSVYHSPFDDHDVIGRPRTLAERVNSFVRGGGW